MMRLVIAAAAIVISGQATADWRVDSVRDRMTDRQLSAASVQANAPDRGIPARLRLACMNGAPMLSVDLGAELTWGQIGAVWRLDEGPQRPVFLRVFADPQSVPLVGTDPASFAGKKRFRLQLQPTGSQAFFWEFDVSGLEKVLPKIRC
jgi:hypothetical protein